jgi:hypothetical protein
LGEIATRAGAGIGETGGKKLLHGCAVKRQALGLAEFTVPRNAEPAEVFLHSVGELGPRALRVEVLVAQQKLSAGIARALMRDPESARVAEVKQTGWGWGESADVHERSGEWFVIGGY